MAKVTFDSDRCKGCALCVDACPKKIIVIAKNKINAKGHSPAEVTQPRSASAALSAPRCAPAA